MSEVAEAQKAAPVVTAASNGVTQEDATDAALVKSLEQKPVDQLTGPMIANLTVEQAPLDKVKVATVNGNSDSGERNETNNMDSKSPPVEKNLEPHVEDDKLELNGASSASNVVDKMKPPNAEAKTVTTTPQLETPPSEAVNGTEENDTNVEIKPAATEKLDSGKNTSDDSATTAPASQDTIEQKANGLDQEKNEIKPTEPVAGNISTSTPEPAENQKITSKQSAKVQIEAHPVAPSISSAKPTTTETAELADSNFADKPDFPLTKETQAASNTNIKLPAKSDNATKTTSAIVATVDKSAPKEGTRYSSVTSTAKAAPDIKLLASPEKVNETKKAEQLSLTPTPEKLIVPPAIARPVNPNDLPPVGEKTGTISTPQKDQAASSSPQKAKTSPAVQKLEHESMLVDSLAGTAAAAVEPASGLSTGAKHGKRKKKAQAKPAVDSEDDDGQGRQSKRVRLQYQPFQSPQVLNNMIPQFFRTPSHATSKSGPDDKIVVFQKGEFLAVRNESGTFFICRTAQKVYKSSRKFKIRWLSDDKKNPDKFTLDFYDQTDFECVLTNLRMNKFCKGVYQLPEEERKRTMNILERALNVEKGVSDAPDPRQFAEDGVDVSFVGKEEEEEVIKSVKSGAKGDSHKAGPSETRTTPSKVGRPKKVVVEIPSPSESSSSDGEETDVSDDDYKSYRENKKKTSKKEKKVKFVKKKELKKETKLQKVGKVADKKASKVVAKPSKEEKKKKLTAKKEKKLKKKELKKSKKIESKTEPQVESKHTKTPRTKMVAEKTPKLKLTPSSSSAPARRSTRGSGGPSSSNKTSPSSKSNRNG